MAEQPLSESSRWARWEVLLLLVPVSLWASLVLLDAHTVDPDSYLHVGVARRLVEDGWVSVFEWLPHTTLHDPYPNMYLAQHLLLAPLVAALGPELALRLGIVLLSALFALSVFLVLRRAGVRLPAVWVVLGLLGSPLAMSYALSLKGAATFLILLPWFVEAVWRADRPVEATGWRRVRSGWWRVGLLAWLSVYVYVGASVLVGFTLAHLAVTRVWEGRWELRPLLATVGGLLVGMTLHPSWPAQWEYVGRELLTVFARDAELVAGELRGGEWSIVSTEMLLRLVGAVLAAWALALLGLMRTGARVDRDVASGALASFGLLLGGLLSGTKLLHLALVFSLLTVPRLVGQLRGAPLGWMWAALLLVGLGASGHAYVTMRAERVGDPGPRPADYEVMAEWLEERTGAHEMVLSAWDDMPGLFLFGEDQRFMAGFNVQFLRDQDVQRYHAYVFFVRGQLEDPERAMVQFFDGARWVVLRRQPRSEGEAVLAMRLADRREHFEELASPVSQWRVFRRHSGAL